jgi:uncharacterized protein YcsI (UPF0317 family)
MSRPPIDEVVALAAEMRAIARRGGWRGSTTGQSPAYQQANLVTLPKEATQSAKLLHPVEYSRQEGERAAILAGANNWPSARP